MTYVRMCVLQCSSDHMTYCTIIPSKDIDPVTVVYIWRFIEER